MKREDAKEKLCPFTHNKCVVEECMAWVVTANGKVEIDRKIEPYDMTPCSIGRWSENIKNDGYENIGRCDGFRNNYVKYEEKHEGYCSACDIEKK